MIPVQVSNDLSWYLDLLRNDGKCCQSWKGWSGKLYEAGIFWEERRSWSEWEMLFLSNREVRKFCWKPQTWKRNGEMISDTLQVDLNQKEMWKFWHQMVHAAKYAEKRKQKWSEWGEVLEKCGVGTLLPAVPENLDSNSKVALTEKLFVARYADVQRIKDYIDSLLKNVPATYHQLEVLGQEMCREYEAFSRKEISFEIQRKLGVWTCPYCNSHYLEPRINYKSGRIHPGMQIDHFYPKEKYGILSMSLFNLVPSCSYCNHEKGSSALKASVYNKDAHAYDTVFRFELSPSDNVDFLMDKKVSLYLQVNRHEGTALQNAQDVLSDACEVLHLAQRRGTELDRVKYNHGLAVVEELVEIARNNPFEQRLLIGEFGFPEKTSKLEWYQKVFGKWYEEAKIDFLKSSYSKLKADILSQLLESVLKSDTP